MTTTATDQELVNQILAGNQAAFSMLIKNTEKLVAQIVFKMISSPSERQDIAQDVFVQVFRSLKDFRFQAKLSTWVAQIAYHACLKSIRRRKLVLVEDYEQTGHLSAGDDQPDTVFSKKELKAALGAAMERLPPLYRTLIALFHQEQLSLAEIAEITGLPQGTVKSYLFRARQQLKDILLTDYLRESQ